MGIDPMTGSPQEPRYRIHADRAAVGTAVAARLRDVMTAAVTARGVAHVVLTGGSMGEEVMRALAEPPDGSGAELDPRTLAAVHLWWGDERYLPAGDPDRNDTQADGAGLGRLLQRGLDPDRVHRLPGPDDPLIGDDLVGAARSYADELRRAADTGVLPRFDVVMLGVGPDGHVASLFPGHPATVAPGTASSTVVPITGSPKPPPRRLSLSLPALESAAAVWLVVSGADKAEAVERARTVHDPHACPAGAVRGTEETIWWLDTAAHPSGDTADG